MTQYNILNVKLSNLQINKLKSRIKNGTEVPLKLSSNAISDSNDKNNFPHKLLLTNTHISKLHKVLHKFKLKFHKIGQSGGLLVRILSPLPKNGLPLMKILLKPLAERVLIPLELTAAASPTDAAIHKKVFGSGMTTLIISNKEKNDIMEIVTSLEESDLLVNNSK